MWLILAIKVRNCPKRLRGSGGFRVERGKGDESSSPLYRVTEIWTSCVSSGLYATQEEDLLAFGKSSIMTRNGFIVFWEDTLLKRRVGKERRDELGCSTREVL